MMLKGYLGWYENHLFMVSNYIFDALDVLALFMSLGPYWMENSTWEYEYTLFKRLLVFMFKCLSETVYQKFFKLQT